MAVVVAVVVTDDDGLEDKRAEDDVEENEECRAKEPGSGHRSREVLPDFFVSGLHDRTESVADCLEVCIFDSGRVLRIVDH